MPVRGSVGFVTSALSRAPHGPARSPPGRGSARRSRAGRRSDGGAPAAKVDACTAGPPRRSPSSPDEASRSGCTTSSTRELVVAAAGEDATLYVCGITPYDATHIGHAATYVAFDLLVRAWTDAGHRVRYASNVTDVDDPLLERAAATGVDWRALAVEQTALFAEDMTALGVVPPDVYEGAVETIPAVVDAVTQLLDAGLAYRVPVEPAPGGTDPGLGDVYADLSADRAFGSVSRLARDVMEHLFAERGGDPDREGKKDALDPLLWRRERPGEPAWDGGALGTGRPGWHVECAVISRDGLGLPFDVQGGERTCCSRTTRCRRRTTACSRAAVRPARTCTPASSPTRARR